ncbi:MAG: hypothetical protein ACOVK9_09715 [Bacteroidia bacterium]
MCSKFLIYSFLKVNKNFDWKTTQETNLTITGYANLTPNGCGGPNCKELSHLSIEAAPGTYSAISRTVLSGGFTYGILVMGPILGSDPFQGL